MNSKIINALKPLGISVYFLLIPVDTKIPEEYILFQTIDERDIGVFDNEPTATRHTCTLNFWFEKSSGANKARQIKQLLKDNGFIVTSSVDIHDENNPKKYGKNIDFEYTEYLS